MAEPQTNRAWALGTVMAAALADCAKADKSPIYAMPEVNDANCRFDAIEAIPADDARQRFADRCAGRPRPLMHSEHKPYSF